jgi:hypothetical protein
LRRAPRRFAGLATWQRQDALVAPNPDRRPEHVGWPLDARGRTPQPGDEGLRVLPVRAGNSRGVELGRGDRAGLIERSPACRVAGLDDQPLAIEHHREHARIEPAALDIGQRPELGRRVDADVDQPPLDPEALICAHDADLIGALGDDRLAVREGAFEPARQQHVGFWRRETARASARRRYRAGLGGAALGGKGQQGRRSGKPGTGAHDRRARSQAAVAGVVASQCQPRMVGCS